MTYRNTKLPLLTLVRAVLIGWTMWFAACDLGTAYGRAADTGGSEDSTGVITSPIPSAVLDTLNGIDLSKIKNLASVIRSNTTYPDIHSLLIMRSGTLVFEEYFNGYSRENVHTLQSVTKSLTSAAIGIAIEKGDIQGVDEKVVDFFPDWKDSLITDPRKARIRIEDMLTMRTGTDYHESGPDSPHTQLNRLRFGWDKFWLDRPMVNEPGSVWLYDSGGVVTLSSVLKNRTGKHADKYLDDHLFSRMEITNVEWARNSEGHPHTGGGLRMRPLDMLAFGQLYLQDGLWNGTQVVPPTWIQQSVQRKHVFDPPQGPGGIIEAYGYLWWILAPDPQGVGNVDIYAAMGFRGQYIFVIPEHEMVVVVTSWLPPAEQGKPVGFLYSDILPAVIR